MGNQPSVDTSVCFMTTECLRKNFLLVYNSGTKHLQTNYEPAW